MRMLVTLVCLTLLAPTATAIAGPAPAAPPVQRPAAQAAPRPAPPPIQLAPIDLTVVPEPCKPLAKQALAPTLSIALSARVSLARCMADRAIASLELCDCGESIAAINTASAPAIALLDDVAANGDAANQVLAEHAEGQLYAGFAVRMLATVPRPAAGAPEAEVALCDMRKQTLEAQLAPWREAALASFQHVVEIARAHPALATNRAVTTAVRDSEQRLAAEVAAR